MSADLPDDALIVLPARGESRFRKLIGRDPSKNDFRGDQARGRPFVSANESWIEHTGLSVYDTPELAVRIGTRWPAYVAEVRLPAGVGCSSAKTAGRGHFTIWGKPDDLFASIAAV